MKLETLDASLNQNITNIGLKILRLKKLKASYNSKITIDGIAHMPDIIYKTDGSIKELLYLLPNYNNIKLIIK